MDVHPIVRLSLGIVLITYIGGCATFNGAALPAAGQDERQEDTKVRVLSVGDVARITLENGEIVTGDVTHVSKDDVSLGLINNYGYEERVFRTQDIVSLEQRNDGGVGKSLLLVGCFLGVLMVYGYHQLSTYDWN